MYKVTISTLFIDGVKHKRGDIVDVPNPEVYGTRLEPHVVVEVEEKPKRKRKVKTDES